MLHNELNIQLNFFKINLAVNMLILCMNTFFLDSNFVENKTRQFSQI